MSEKLAVGLMVLGAVTALLVWIHYLDRLMRYKPTGQARREFQRTREMRRPLSDQEIQRLLSRKPFLHSRSGESTSSSSLPPRYSREDYPDPL